MESVDKSLNLRVIEDAEMEPVSAIRLYNYETEQRRLQKLELAEKSQRLELLNGDKAELRTHQPGIDNFYNYEFTDAEHWMCFRLTALDSEETVFGYTDAKSDLARVLLQQLERYGKGRVRLLIRLTIPEGLQSRNGVVIEKLLCPRWLYLDSPDSGS